MPLTFICFGRVCLLSCVFPSSGKGPSAAPCMLLGQALSLPHFVFASASVPTSPPFLSKCLIQEPVPSLQLRHDLSYLLLNLKTILKVSADIPSPARPQLIEGTILVLGHLIRPPFKPAAQSGELWTPKQAPRLASGKGSH